MQQDSRLTWNPAVRQHVDWPYVLWCVAASLLDDSGSIKRLNTLIQSNLWAFCRFVHLNATKYGFKTFEWYFILQDLQLEELKQQVSTLKCQNEQLQTAVTQQVSQIQQHKDQYNLLKVHLGEWSWRHHRSVQGKLFPELEQSARVCGQVFVQNSRSQFESTTAQQFL